MLRLRRPTARSPWPRRTGQPPTWFAWKSATTDPEWTPPRCPRPLRRSSRVSRRAGAGWLLVGDAAGFLDPFTGEGIHRALVSAELAADAIDSLRAGRRHAAEAADAYQQALRARFRAKDWVSSLVQLFLGEPRLFEYAARRLAARPGQREMIGLVMGDLVPAERGLDPRFLASLLRP